MDYPYYKTSRTEVGVVEFKPSTWLLELIALPAKPPILMSYF